MLIFILTLVVVGGAFALYQFGDQVLVRMATPSGHYREPPKASGPDYSKTSAWLSHPDLRDDPSRWAPEGDEPGLAQPTVMTTFYVHPTTYLERDRWNAPLDPGGEERRRAELFAQSQASIFLDGKIWAPKYRQAAFGAFLLKSEDARKALDLAYRDVLAAFDRFLTENPGNGPIVLAGHSQGSMHVLRLLRDRSSALKGRLVAAYIIGWPVGVTSDLPATGVPACTKPEETGCVLSWQSFKEPANPHLVIKAWVGTEGLTGAARTREDMLCTNPLTGAKDGAAAPGSNKGSLVPNGSLTEARLDLGRVGARCDEGFLKVEGDLPNLGPYVLPGNNYHVYDYALFWGSVRADVRNRFHAWIDR